MAQEPESGEAFAGEFLEGKLWFQRKGSVLTVGLTNSAIELIGELASIDLPDEGESVKKGEVILTIDGSRGNLEFAIPVSGTIQEVNEAARDEPEMVSEDPLEEGWLVRLEIQDASQLEEDRG